MDTQAKVFISCGQRKHELKWVNQICGILENLGFRPFVAAHHYGDQPMVPQIINELHASDYFLFVDFHRNKDKNHNFSLYAHQELAIARQIGLPILAFRDNKLPSALGMSSGWLDNAIPFGKPKDLIELIKDEVSNAGWSTENYNRLVVGDVICDEIKGQLVKEPEGREVIFRLLVSNGSNYRDAHNCIVYVYRDDGAPLTRPGWPRCDPRGHPDSIQGVKWEGISELGAYFRRVVVVRKRRLRFERSVEALLIKEGSKYAFLLTVGDEGKRSINPFFKVPQEFNLIYALISDNFAPVTVKVKVTLSENFDECKMEKVTTAEG